MVKSLSLILHFNLSLCAQWLQALIVLPLCPQRRLMSARALIGIVIMCVCVLPVHTQSTQVEDGDAD